MGFFGRCTLQQHPRRSAIRFRTLFTLLLAAASPILLRAQYSDNQTPPSDQPYADQSYPPPQQYPAQQQYPAAQQPSPYAGQVPYGQQQYGQQQYGQQQYPQQQYPYAGQQQQQLLSPQQLDDLVAPVALYPDPLVGELLAASTYPMEVAQAEQWVRDHNGWQPDALLNAAKQQNWDASVQGLVAFPSVLAQMTQNMSWTTDLGNAFLAQQGDVMQAIQRMRQQAQSRGMLRSTPQEVVTDQYQNGQPYIDIEPASPDVIYVPAYNPVYVWGPPAYGYYPALYYPAGGFSWGFGINLSFCFGHFGWAGWGGWGWRPNWFGHGLWVNAGFFNRYGFHNYGFHGGPGAYGHYAWTHSPEHRLGVPYANRSVAARFGQSGYNNNFRAASYNHATYNNVSNHTTYNNAFNRGVYNNNAYNHGGAAYGQYNHSNYANSYNRSNFAQPSHYSGSAGYEQHAFAGNRNSFNSGYHAAPAPRIENNYHYSSPAPSHSSYSGGGYHGNGGGSSHSSGGGGGSSFHGGGGGGSHGGGGGHSGGGHR